MVNGEQIKSEWTNSERRTRADSFIRRSLIRGFQLCLLCLILAAPVALMPPARAQSGGEGVQLFLDNVPIQDEKLLVVNVRLTNLTDLFGAEFQLRYDPARLAVRDDNRRLEGAQISPGPLIAGDDRFVVTNRANPETGQVNFAFTLLKPAPPISGDGVLATVVFEIVGEGPFTVNVDSVQLVSAGLESVPVTPHNLTVNGQTAEPPPPAESAAPGSAGLWQALAAAAVVGLLVVLAALVLLGARRTATLPPETLQAETRKIPGGVNSSIRSAALLAEQGMAALQQGDSERAYDLFSRAIELDPANAEAWLGKGLMARQPTEKRICLQRVLALEPSNAAARTELEKLRTVNNE